MDVVALVRNWLRPSSVEDAKSYQAYTTDFDVVVDAKELDKVLGPLPAAHAASLEEAWSAFTGALQGWRTKLHLACLESASRLRRELTDEKRSDTAVTILVDQSGSMKGQSILLAAASADVASEFLRHLGISVEVSGFTTVSWRGGKSRRRWQMRGKPRHPGRLCDLLHVIYRSADDERASTGGWDFRPMLRPNLLKENVDGEAIQWAAGRLRARPQRRKLLFVISDGAPVDDSTLMANTLDILTQHLAQVVGELERSRDVGIAAVGIGFDVGRYYSSATTVSTPEALGDALIGLLERTLSDPFTFA